MRKLLAFLLVPVIASVLLAQVKLNGNVDINKNVNLNGAAGGGGGGTVTFDSVPFSGGSGCAQAACTSHQLTWNHSIGAAADNAIFVGCNLDPGSVGNDTGMSLTATFNSVSMTSITTKHQNNTTVGFSQLFVANGVATGSHAVVVTIAGDAGSASNLICGSVSLTGVNQTTPTANTNTAAGNSGSIAVTVTSASNDMVIDVAGNGSPFSSSLTTQRWQANDGFSTANCNAGCNAGSSTHIGAASVNMGYTVNADFWSIIGVDVQHD